MAQEDARRLDFNTERSIFVVSDLHLGDRSSAFIRSGKDVSFLRFLDHVAGEGGQLLVLGDLLELWRFTLDALVECWQGLLDRLLQLQAIYIPGNHDARVADPKTRDLHPFFARVCEPFRVRMGDKCFQFMHGHELDPLTNGRFHENDLYRHGFQAFFDLRERVHWIGHEALADIGLGLSESCLRLWQWLTRVSDQVLHPELTVQLATVAQPALRHKRTHKMLSRYLYHREAARYDVAVVGHTHRVGCWDSWYYNSGCWVKPCNSFLKIHPDAHTEVFNWAERQALPNTTIVGV